MSMPMQTAYHAAVDEAVTSLFRTMLATEVAPAEHKDTHQETVTALVGFGGGWQGAFEFECGRPEAVAFAQRFMQADDLNEFNEDVRDTVGELANVIAGNLKSVLPAGITMSAPTIIEGKDYKITVCGEKLLDSATFSTDAGCFTVRLIEDPK